MPRITVDEKIIGYGVVKDAPEPAQPMEPKAQAANRATAGNQAGNGWKSGADRRP